MRLLRLFFGGTIILVQIAYDPAKRARTLKERGLDFRDARLVFAGRIFTVADQRKDYGEDRFISVGYLHRRLVAIVWTQRGATRRIISMRYCHAKEAKAWTTQLD